jgi:hypothetical protein
MFHLRSAIFYRCKTLSPEAGGEHDNYEEELQLLIKAVYTQRTSCERINSQAKALGIERSKVRNQHFVANLNTLTYLIINVRAL